MEFFSYFGSGLARFGVSFISRFGSMCCSVRFSSGFGLVRVLLWIASGSEWIETLFGFRSVSGFCLILGSVRAGFRFDSGFGSVGLVV